MGIDGRMSRTTVRSDRKWLLSCCGHAAKRNCRHVGVWIIERKIAALIIIVMSQILFENKNLTIIFYEDKNYLFLKWSGFIPSEEFKALATEILSAIDKTETHAVMSDNTDWKVINPNDHGWAANHWFPAAEKKGISKFATVLSNDFFNRAAENNIEGMADVNCMQIKNFTTAEEAMKWLMPATAKASTCL